MKIISKISLLFLITILVGCVGPSNNPLLLSEKNENNRSDEKYDVDIYVKNCFDDYCNKYEIGSSSYYDDPENNSEMAYFICESTNNVFYVANKAIYKIEEENAYLLVESNKNIFALIGEYNNSLFYVLEESTRNEYSIWELDINSNESHKVFEEKLYLFDTILFENMLIVKERGYDGDLLFYDSLNKKEIIIEQYYQKENDEINGMIPSGFVVRKTQYSPTLGNEIELYYKYGERNERVGLARNQINEAGDEEYRSLFEYHAYQKINYIDNDMYNFYLFSEDIKSSKPPMAYGTSEGCKSKYWNKDIITKIEGPDYLSNKNVEKTIYEDSVNRILCYNPLSNEVYLYVFEDDTIVSKNLDNQSEKIIEELEEADEIHFQWCDTRLYWVYVKNNNEEYGGVHEFGN